MLARRPSAERFSPGDFEVESLSRKTNNIVILRGRRPTQAFLFLFLDKRHSMQAVASGLGTKQRPLYC
jgi:hypothetical protein